MLLGEIKYSFKNVNRIGSTKQKKDKKPQKEKKPEHPDHPDGADEDKKTRRKIA